jgi:4-amino-4-deoxy-L-arabinose transferase and related glycosyltransferases of PMT family
MKKKNKSNMYKKSNKLWEYLSYKVIFLPLLFCFPVYIINNNLLFSQYFRTNSENIMILIYVLYFFFGYWMINKNMPERKAVFMLIMGGFLLRAFYILITPYNISPHDIGGIKGFETNGFGIGHVGYIEYIYKYHQLPDFDPRQAVSFYNPPLHYILAALWIKINRIFGASWSICLESIQVLTLFYTTTCITVIYRILKEFDIKGKALYIIFTIISFHPVFIAMSASIGNDSLSLLFTLTAIYYTIRWHKETTLKNIVILAVLLAAAVLTKASAALILPAIAVVFVYTIVKRKDDWKKYLLQYVLFTCIFCLLGLFWMMRCYILFGMPLTYVPKLTKENWLYIGNYSIFQRFGLPTLRQMLYFNNDLNSQMSCNIWIQMFRTSLYDEKPIIMFYGKTKIIAVILLWVNILLAVIMNIYNIKGFIKKKGMPNIWKLFFLTAYIILLGSFIKFAYQYPHICSLNFRYIAISLLYVGIGAMSYFSAYGDMKKEKIMLYLCLLMTAAFVLITIILYVIYLSSI